MKTGLTMTITTFVVMVIIFIIATTMANAGLTPIAKLNSIAAVLIIGLAADTVATWFMNAGILKWYVEERGGKFNLFGRKWRRKRY